MAERHFRWLSPTTGGSPRIFEIMMGFPDKYLFKRSKDLP
jgi:hypothetical protein